MGAMGVAAAPVWLEDDRRRPFPPRTAGGGVRRPPSAEREPEPEQSPSPPPMSSCGRYVLHRVCRFDTLAGVAIKYGVEVADVKRVNGLTTDLQMFAHKTLRIPLTGRHPPAALHSSPPSAPNATDHAREWTTRRPPMDPFLKPPRSTASPSMSLLQGYYGLKPAPKSDPTTEMVTYTKGQHRKAMSLSTDPPPVNGDGGGWETDDADKPIRRRQKGEHRVALRPTLSSGVSEADIKRSQQDLVSARSLPSYGDGLLAVRKSSSTPEFQDSDNNSLASLWLRSKWSLKPDAFTLPLQIPLFDSIPKSLFDSIPKPVAAWVIKAARD